MTFEKAFSTGLRLARRFGGPQYLIEWQGDWAVCNYRPRSGLRYVTIDLSDFGQTEGKVKLRAVA